MEDCVDGFRSTKDRSNSLLKIQYKFRELRSQSTRSAYVLRALPESWPCLHFCNKKICLLELDLYGPTDREGVYDVNREISLNCCWGLFWISQNSMSITTSPPAVLLLVVLVYHVREERSSKFQSTYKLKKYSEPGATIYKESKSIRRSMDQQ